MTILRGMSSKEKIPICMICGKLGAPLGTIGGREIIICNDCVTPLYEMLGVAVTIAKGARQPKKPAARRQVSPEEFKAALERAVESKGRILLIPFAERRKVPRDVARSVAERLATEKGWILEGEGEKMAIAKPA